MSLIPKNHKQFFKEKKNVEISRDFSTEIINDQSMKFLSLKNRKLFDRDLL